MERLKAYYRLTKPGIIYGNVMTTIAGFVLAAIVLVAIIFVGTLITVIGIAVYVGRKTSGEISEFGSHRSLWRI